MRGGSKQAMDNEIVPVDPDGEDQALVEMSGLRDRIETLERTMGGTLGAGVVTTLLFIFGAMFMERASTVVFLAAAWSLLTLRLVLINRRSGHERRIAEAALESLEDARQGPALPPTDH
ncbi:MAG: hypothetical protein ACYS22_21530, partial [Planctomycetota bacterium]